MKDKNPELIFDFVDDKNQVVDSLKLIIKQIKKDDRLKNGFEEEKSFASTERSNTMESAYSAGISSTDKLSVLVDKSDFGNVSNIDLKRKLVVKV